MMHDKHTHDKKARRRLRRVAVLPVFMTLLNAVCGFTAIIFAARGMEDSGRLLLERPELTFLTAAALMIFLGMVADVLDGQLARMTQSATSFGGHLDSMSDMLTFGAAPAFLMLVAVESSPMDIGPAQPIFAQLPGKLIYLFAVMYVCCTALRLARFNVENQPEHTAHMGFSGLPCPAAAGVVASLVLLYSDICRTLEQQSYPVIAKIGSQGIIYTLPIFTVLMALMMVSQIPYRHLVNQYIRGRRPFAHVVRFVVIVLLLCWQVQLTLAVCFLLFAFGPAGRWVWQRKAKKMLMGSEKHVVDQEFQKGIPGL